MTDGYVTGIALNEDDEIIGYQFVNFWQDDGFSSKPEMSLLLLLKKQKDSMDVFDDAVKIIDPRKE